MHDHIRDVHSVTCAICGEIADGRRTVNLNPEQQHAGAPESYERIGRVFAARELVGSGEVHESCLMDLPESYEE